MHVNILVPLKPSEVTVDTITGVTKHQPPLRPFQNEVAYFVASFSRSILTDSASRQFPQAIAMASFFRASQISKLAKQFVGKQTAAARGTIFHIAPANVDTIFLYSSLLSFLCGNTTIVRISRKYSEQIGYLLRKLNDTLDSSEPDLRNRFIIITYDYDEAITQKLSLSCNMRVVWGGDATVSAIRSIPLRPTATELCFPNRFSVAAIDAGAIRQIGEEQLREVCRRFASDSMQFSQQACSSPRLIAWIGNEESCQIARAKFWRICDEELKKHTQEISPGMIMDRLVARCIISTDVRHIKTQTQAESTRILLKSTPLENLRDLHCGNGLFFEQFHGDIDAFVSTLSDTEQTLSIYGIDRDDLEKAVSILPSRAIDRIVEIGHALDFDCVWDGVNLLTSFTRIVSIGL